MSALSLSLLDGPRRPLSSVPPPPPSSGSRSVFPFLPAAAWFLISELTFYAQKLFRFLNICWLLLGRKGETWPLGKRLTAFQICGDFSVFSENQAPKLSSFPDLILDAPLSFVRILCESRRRVRNP